MRISVCNELFKGLSWEETLSIVSEVGYEGIEVAPFTIARDIREVERARRSELSALIRSYGLEVSALHWLLVSPPGLHLAHPNSLIRRKTVEYMGVLAQLCADLDCSLMVLGSPNQRCSLPGQSRSETWALLRDSLKESVRLAEEWGVRIALEPLARHLTDMINTADEAIRMVEEVGSPYLVINLDVYSMTYEGRPYREIIARVNGLLAHFHANDTNGLGPGFGKADYEEIIAALKLVGYTGWLSVEVLAEVDNPVVMAKLCLKLLRQLLKC